MAVVLGLYAFGERAEWWMLPAIGIIALGMLVTGVVAGRRGQTKTASAAFAGAGAPALAAVSWGLWQAIENLALLRSRISLFRLVPCSGGCSATSTRSTNSRRGRCLASQSPACFPSCSWFTSRTTSSLPPCKAGG